MEKIEQWCTTDSSVFATEADAKMHQSYLDVIDFIKSEIEVDKYIATRVFEFIETYTKGWKE